MLGCCDFSQPLAHVYAVACNNAVIFVFIKRSYSIILLSCPNQASSHKQVINKGVLHNPVCQCKYEL